MTYKEEQYILDSIDQIKEEVHFNNLMLCDICGAVNVYLSNHSAENEADFGRNVLANLISGMVNLNGFKKR